MNILWSVNTLMPNVAKKIGVKSSHAISWIDAMSKEIIKLIKSEKIRKEKKKKHEKI